MRRPSYLFAIFLNMLLITADVALIWAEPASQQRGIQLSKEALKQFKAGDYRKAIATFRQSEALHSHKSNLYYIAEAYRRLGELRKSFEIYSRYAKYLPAEKQESFSANLQKLRWEKPCSISIATTPGGATIIVNGKPQGKTPGDGNPMTLTLHGGTYEINIRLPGYGKHVRRVNAEFGEPQALSFILQKDLATLRVRSKTAKLQLRLDEQNLGETPLEKKIPSGAHRLHATAEGYQPQIIPFTLAVGAVKEIELSLEPVSAGSHANSSNSPSAPENPASRKGTMSNQPHAGGPFLGILLGPALPFYGDTNLEVGAAFEAGAEAGYRWQPWDKSGFHLHLNAFYSPINDADIDERAGFLLVLAGVGGQIAIMPRFWLDVRCGVGVSLLLGASKNSFMFTGAEDVSGVFPSLAIRPAVGVNWEIWRGLIFLLYPLALDYSPRHETYNSNISHVLRYHATLGLAWQF